jgi:hypothetical protein
MPTIMLIIIWGTFLLMSVGMILHGIIRLFHEWDRTTIFKEGPDDSELQAKLEHTKRRADKKRGQKNS